MKILVVTSRFPYPIEKGDKLRLFRQLEQLSAKNEIDLICLNESNPDQEEMKQVLKYCANVEVVLKSGINRKTDLLKTIFNRLPFQINYFHSSKMNAAISRKLTENKYDLVYAQLIRVVENLPENPGVPVFLDYMDSFARGMKKRLRLSPWFLRPFIRMEARRLFRYEKEVKKKVQGYSFITKADIRKFNEEFRNEALIIPNGVDSRFLHAEDKISEKKEFDIIFTGNMGYHPNIKACKYLIHEILPALQRRGLNPRICIAGARPSREVLKLADERVIVTGFVEDLRDFMGKSRIYMAPMISGSGLQNKLLESMAMGLPTLTTPLANKALGAIHEEHIMICDGASEFADKTLELLQEDELYNRLSQSGRAFVEENFDWEKSCRKLEQAFQTLVNGGELNTLEPEEKVNP